MKTYLYTLLEEKGIDLDDTFEITTGGNLHIFEYGAILEAILSAPEGEQQAIRKNLVKIDFANGQIEDYLQHLAKALV